MDHGIHTLAIKDMAGLLKPRAATMLVGAAIPAGALLIFSCLLASCPCS